MNFFTIKTTWSNVELGLVKACVASMSVLVGAYFHNFFREYYIPVTILFVITVIWTAYLWLGKMKEAMKS